jgi:predicted ATPase/DNA-binding winged helix-turn-helix (wHTH) protein
MKPVQQGSVCFAFGRFRVLPQRRQLLDGDVTLELGSRAFDVLMVLLEARGSLVTKDELLDRVWPGTIVEENNIQVQVSTLRKALGEDRKLIQTVPQRGYRFTAETRITNGEADADPSGIVDAPAMETARPVLTNVPAAVSEFIGREEELRELQPLIQQHRLVTLIGPGGIGKTRLGLEIARATLPDFPDGVWVAEFASLSDPKLVPGMISAALGLQADGTRWTPEQIAAALGTKQLLLVLDNCEHVVATAAAEAEALLHAVPGMRILATSQEPLGVDGECIYRLRPLGFPAEDSAEGDDAPHDDAVRLFIARARTADPQIKFHGHMAAVATICRRLDGIPLAIELAAARAPALGIEGLAQRLDDRFHLLTSGRRTALPRYQTLRATLDWSHKLLTTSEQLVLRRVAVFAGSFSLAAAAAVVADAGMAEWEAIDGIAELVAKSLVVVDAAGSVRHYRLLETTRAYLLEKLNDSGEAAEILRRHACYYQTLCQRAEAEAKTCPAGEWLKNHGSDIDNVRAALDWAFSPEGDASIGMAITIASVPLLSRLSRTDECRRRLERALASARPGSGQNAQRQMKLRAALSQSLTFVPRHDTETAGALARMLELAHPPRDTDDQLQARPWEDQGRTSAAREVLGSVCDRVTEGFNTAHFKAARALVSDPGRPHKRVSWNGARW